MTDNSYGIEPYRGEFAGEVADLLRSLVGPHIEENLSYLKWKYHDNPYSDRPLGIVALYAGRVVGFRGYFVTRWQVPEKSDRIFVLGPGDTCVHPDHRMKGLSILMGNRAMEDFESDYTVLLNMTATKNSLPGYRRMGFLPLEEKVYLNRYTPGGLVRFLISATNRFDLAPKHVVLGEFGDLVVSEEPWLKAMEALAFLRLPPKFTLYQDGDFFGWRFGNRMKRYLFYYLKRDNLICAFAVIGVSPNPRRGYVLDYAGTNIESVEAIFREISGMRHFDVISIYRFSLENDLRNRLEDLGFKPGGFLRRLEKKIKGELPLLVRPVEKSLGAKDFFLEGLDIREPKNWHIRGICSDAA